MKVTDGISIAARDVNRRKLRSLLTIIAIAVGTLLLVSMQSLGDTISNTTAEFISSFGNMNQVMVLPQKYNPEKSGAAVQEQMSSGSQGFLPYTPNQQLNPKEEDNSKAITDSTLQEISKIKNVESIAAYGAAKATSLSIDGVKDEGLNPLILGYNKNYNYTAEEEIVAGQPLDGKGDQFLINESLLKQMGITDYNSVVGKTFKIDVSLPKSMGINMPPLVITGTVRGVYTEPNSYYPGNIITYENIINKINAYYSGKQVNDVANSYSNVLINVKNQSVIPGINQVVNNNLGYTTFSLGEVIGIASVFTGFIKTILDLAAIIVIVVASIGLINTMTMTIQEKKKWIGIMRALGATKNNIRIIFLTQSIILGIIGGVVGAIVAVIGIEVVNVILTNIGKDFHIVVTFGNALFGFVIAVIVAIIAGLIPSSRAAKLDVVETINEE
ncbi:MAG: ABC transporter permease [Sarcina sp.]